MARGLRQPRGRTEQAYQTATLSAVVAETMDPATSGTARATACSHCGTADQSEEGDGCQEPPQHWRWPYWSIHITVSSRTGILPPLASPSLTQQRFSSVRVPKGFESKRAVPQETEKLQLHQCGRGPSKGWAPCERHDDDKAQGP